MTYLRSLSEFTVNLTYVGHKELILGDLRNHVSAMVFLLLLSLCHL